MDSKSNPKIAALIPLLVIGISLNTLGIVLQSLGGLRFVLMGAGIFMMLVVVVKMIRLRNEDKGNGGD